MQQQQIEEECNNNSWYLNATITNRIGNTTTTNRTGMQQQQLELECNNSK
jgi:hypothetical protein